MNDQRLAASQKRPLTAIVRRTHDTRQYRRALAVRECDTGKSAAQIAQVLRVSRQSVYSWIEGFWQTCDAQALSGAPRSGILAVGASPLSQLACRAAAGR
jgi:hypothetical protein